MARIVLGIGTSHTPLLTLTAEHWHQRSAADLSNKQLNISDGRFVTYEQLLAEVGPRYADIASPEILIDKARRCQAAMDRLAAEVAAATPDLVIIVGDDQRELYTANNQPALAVYHGDTIMTMASLGRPDAPEWVLQMGRGYMMDQHHEIPAASAWGLALIHSLVDQGFDVTASAGVEDAKKAGFGHAFGFVVQRLFGGRTIPVLPVMLNTYYPPNVPSTARCISLGQAIARAIQEHPSDARVAVIASGGLSHFVVDEVLDRQVLKAIADNDLDALRCIPRAALNSGSSEILNWVVTAGALSGIPVSWQDYIPLYRTPAGTGVGAGFVAWSARCDQVF